MVQNLDFMPGSTRWRKLSVGLNLKCGVSNITQVVRERGKSNANKLLIIKLPGILPGGLIRQHHGNREHSSQFEIMT